jgi:hypothetical protein
MNTLAPFAGVFSPAKRTRLVMLPRLGRGGAPPVALRAPGALNAVLARRRGAHFTTSGLRAAEGHKNAARRVALELRFDAVRFCAELFWNPT